jgi:uncharacterized protein (TIGR00255 family)
LVEANMHTIEGYMKSIATAKQQFPTIAGELTARDLLLIPNAFSSEEGTIDAPTKQKVLELIDEMITQLIEEQHKEGLELKNDINRSMRIMEQEIVNIAKASALLMEEQKIKVQAMVAELEAQEEEKSDGRKNNMYAMLDKMDINEEIVRFKSHLKNLLALFESDDAEKGKRLDFTLQELGREVNTIAAKCSDATIGTMAINVKVELEKTREQTQNIV